MSRVFEALTRASQEKTGVRADTPGNLKPIGRPKTEPERQSPWRNEVPSIKNTGVQSLRISWRDRLEELFFGIDLKHYSRYPIVVMEKDSGAASQYKILRHQVKRLRGETGARFISVTSPIGQDGKTTVAVNLAVAMAMDYEEQVLLIDGDIRASQVHRFFGIPCSPGLADYLSASSQQDLMTFVQKTSFESLSVIPAGTPSSLSAELLAQGKMRSLMEDIRARFRGHQIIIDTPPILSTADPLVIAEHVDGLIMVARARKTPRSYLLKAIQSLNSKKLMGIVLNGAPVGLSDRYYGYYTYYSKHGSASDRAPSVR